MPKVKTQNVTGVKLVTGFDLVCIRTNIKLKARKHYEKCTQITLAPVKDTAEIRFIPLNLFDSTNHDLPFRDLTIASSQILYEYLPDRNIIDAYLHLITTPSQYSAH